MRILIAEDERDLNELIKKRLKNNGYSVDACFNGKEVFSIPYASKIFYLPTQTETRSPFSAGFHCAESCQEG